MIHRLFAIALLLAACRTPAPENRVAGPGYQSRWTKEAREGRSWVELCAPDPDDPACAEAVPREVACPPTRAEIHANEACGLSGATRPATCDYPGEQCTCEAEPYCGGFNPGRFRLMAMEWTCRAPPKPGDCPLKVPVQGSACGVEAQSCHYPDCGSSHDCTCLENRWKCRTNDEGGPPP